MSGEGFDLLELEGESAFDILESAFVTPLVSVDLVDRLREKEESVERLPGALWSARRARALETDGRAELEVVGVAANLEHRNHPLRSKSTTSWLVNLSALM